MDTRPVILYPFACAIFLLAAAIRLQIWQRSS